MDFEKKVEKKVKLFFCLSQKRCDRNR